MISEVFPNLGDSTILFYFQVFCMHMISQDWLSAEEADTIVMVSYTEW